MRDDAVLRRGHCCELCQVRTGNAKKRTVDSVTICDNRNTFKLCNLKKKVLQALHRG